MHLVSFYMFDSFILNVYFGLRTVFLTEFVDWFFFLFFFLKMYLQAALFKKKK